jgi:tight adherence protein B
MVSGILLVGGVICGFLGAALVATYAARWLVQVTIKARSQMASAVELGAVSGVPRPGTGGLRAGGNNRGRPPISFARTDKAFDKRLQAWAETVHALALYAARNGVPGLSRPVEACLAGFPRLARWARGCVRLLGRRGYRSTPEHVCELAVVLLAVIGVVVLVVSGSLLGAVCVTVVAACALGFSVTHALAREKELLREQIPDALRGIEACFHAGLTLPQTFAEVADEIPPPLQRTFTQVSRDIELGYSVDEALRRMRDEADVAELTFVAVALDVQYVSGGDITTVLQRARASVEQALDLQRSLVVHTSQARLSAQIVTLMPFVVLGALSLVSPGYLAPFSASAEGVALLAGAISLMLVGVLLIRRMMRVEIE